MGPRIVVQGITTLWTKASRGAPAANTRAAVPDAAVLPGVPVGDGEALVQVLEADEAGGFALVELGATLHPEFPVTAWRVAFATEGDLVVVTRLADKWGGYPPRERDRVVFRLAAGEWGRAVRNSRLGGMRDWQYTRIVVNVAHLGSTAGPVDPDLFVRTSPTYEVDEQVHLR